jgi:hypothetical protein
MVGNMVVATIKYVLLRRIEMDNYSISMAKNVSEIGAWIVADAVFTQMRCGG